MALTWQREEDERNGGIPAELKRLSDFEQALNSKQLSQEQEIGVVGRNATESARAALFYAFDAWRKERVISLIHPENRASIRVAERLGERLEGRTQLFGREMLCYGTDRESEALRLRQDRPSDEIPLAVESLGPGGGALIP